MWRLAKCVAIIIMALGLQAAAQVTVISGQVNFQGTSVPFAPIQVCSVTSTGTPCTPVGSLYSDYNLAHPLPNPTTADQNGNYTVYAPNLSPPSFYVVQVTPVPGTVWSYVVNAANNGGIPPGCVVIPYAINCGGTSSTSADGAMTNLGMPQAGTLGTTTQSDSLPGAFSVVPGQNLLPDSAFTAGNASSLPYWTTLYGSGITSGWTAASNALTFTGTGSAIPSGTYAESGLFTLPYSASSYTLFVSVTANLTNQIAGGNIIFFTLVTSTGPPNLGTQYCKINLTMGASATYTNSCTVPGNAGTMIGFFSMGTGTAEITNGQTVTFSQPQVNIGALAAYSPTVGYDSFLTQPPLSATSISSGVQAWQWLLSLLPEIQVGTLGSNQTPVTLTSTEQQVLTSVSSAPTWNMGCATGGFPCETKPGLPSTSLVLWKGGAYVVCTGVTTGGTATVRLLAKAASNNETWVYDGGDGMDSLTLPIAVNAGAVTYLFPINAAVAAYPINGDVGAYDLGAAVSSAVAPSGACQVTRATLEVTLCPTDSTVAGQCAILSYTDRSHLIH